MLRFFISIIVCSFFISVAYAAENVTLKSGKEIQVSPDGTWSYVNSGRPHNNDILDVDFYDYRVDSKAYVGKTISLSGEVSFGEYSGEVRGGLYAEHLTLGPKIQIETDGISKAHLKEVYKCFVSCKKKLIGKVVLKTEYSSSGYAQFNLIRLEN